MAKLTRAPGGEGRYCYYYLEDGECTIDNPAIWKRLRYLVHRVIRFTPWIYNKAFAEADEILLATFEDLSKTPDYPRDISFICKKINTQIGREWWKYVKVANPAYYLRMRERAAARIKNRSPEVNHHYYKKYEEYFIQYQRDAVKGLSDYYLSNIVAKKIKYKTGEHFTGKEVLAKFPHMIEEAKQSIIKVREQRAIKEAEKMIRRLDSINDDWKEEEEKERKFKEKMKEHNKKHYEKRKAAGKA